MKLGKLLTLVASLSSIYALFSDTGKRQIQINEAAAQAQDKTASQQEDWLFTDDAGTDAVLRVQKRDTHLGQYCKGVGSGYTGYLSLAQNTRNIYFIFIESAGNPLTDPLVHWQNGGPGCSTVGYGLLGGNGPCRINSQGSGTNFNKFTWMKQANMLYVDEPFGTGLSSSTNNKVVFKSEAAAEDIAVLIRLLFKALPTLAKLPFHLAGESNAGKHIPWLAKKLLHPETSNIPPIPIKSMMIGNGFFDSILQLPFTYNMACTKANGQGPLLKASECEQMFAEREKCRKDGEAYFQVKRRTRKLRMALFDACDRAEVRWAENEHDYYNLYRHCPDKMGSCDPIGGAIERFLNQPAVERAFGANVSPYKMCSDAIYDRNIATDDFFLSMAPIIADLLNSGLPVLIYAGVADFLVGCAGIQAFLERLSWKGQNVYNEARRKPQAWQAGVFWQAQNLVYATVGKSGHVVPEDNPEAALALFSQWVQNQTLKQVKLGTESASLEQSKGCLFANKQTMT